MKRMRFSYSTTVLLALAVPACFAAVSGCSDVETKPAQNDPGAVVAPSNSAEDQAELKQIEAAIAACDALSTSDFLAAHALPQSSALGYAPSDALGLDLLQQTALALGADELAALDAHGFVITDRTRFPTFVYGYDSIYALDLPVYVSADSVLYAVHRSYDAMLAAIETHSLIAEVDAMLTAMRKGLASGAGASLGAQAESDADLYLAVAHSLLTGEVSSPVKGASAASISALVSGATAASGTGEVSLFGVSRDVDFSQFLPRGHYQDTPELQRYFRAMMWLGRIDLRILETQPDGSQVFRRRQLEGAFELEALMDEGATSSWNRVHGAIAGFVGDPDSMTVPELSSLLADLGIASPKDLAGVDDSMIAQAIVTGGYGTQQIASHLMVNGVGAGTMPLSSSFLLFGQAYVIDSHVFSNLVYDRVQKGAALRMMPDPLDVAFAALGSDQAAPLLEPGLAKFSYAPDLCAMREIVDAHGEDYFHKNLYTSWLGSLRALAPGDDLADPASGLPSVAKSEAWGRRLLNTQLASWAELRHDTLLYAKQSYTEGSSCEFPDAYVDPYPAFYGAVAAYAQNGAKVVASLDLSSATWLAPQIEGYFDELTQVALTLQGIAEHERTGLALTEEQMTFINQAVVIENGCGSPFGSTGWYSRLFFDQQKSVDFDPTIADVHTQPTDEAGNPVGRILHVGTGAARLMVVTIDTCEGPRAYAGLASSYFERVTENYERLQDKGWADEVMPTSPTDVPWMSDIVVR